MRRIKVPSQHQEHAFCQCSRPGWGELIGRTACNLRPQRTTPSKSDGAAVRIVGLACQNLGRRRAPSGMLSCFQKSCDGLLFYTQPLMVTQDLLVQMFRPVIAWNAQEPRWSHRLALHFTVESCPHFAGLGPCCVGRLRSTPYGA